MLGEEKVKSIFNHILDQIKLKGIVKKNLQTSSD